MGDYQLPGDEDFLNYLRDGVIGDKILKKTTDAGPERRGRATLLMLHYLYGDGETFERGKDYPEWGEFMRSIPEVRHWRDIFYSKLADELTPLGDDEDEERGTFSKDDVGAYIGVDGLAIHQWPEMKLVLGGANPAVSAEGEYVVTEERTRYSVRFENTTWTWHDRGDLHADKMTYLPKVGIPIPDPVFDFVAWAWAGGEEYPIEIGWEMDETETVEKKATRCGARCKDFETYGTCDRDTYDEVCWQHA